MKFYDRSVSVRIDAGVMRCADKMEHWSFSIKLFNKFTFDFFNKFNKFTFD